MAEKTIISRLKGKLQVCEKKIRVLQKVEVKARTKWTRGYQGFLRAAADLAGLTRHGTK